MSTPIYDNMNDPKQDQPVKTTAAKAIVGGVVATGVAFLGSLGVALEDGVVNGVEWVTISLATLIAFGGVFGGVYQTTNRVK